MARTFIFGVRLVFSGPERLQSNFGLRLPTRWPLQFLKEVG